jgi:hypothetical protein
MPILFWDNGIVRNGYSVLFVWNFKSRRLNSKAVRSKLFRLIVLVPFLLNLVYSYTLGMATMVHKCTWSLLFSLR